MGEHIELESQIVGHSAFKIGLGRNLVVEIVEGVEPFILGLDGGADTEFGGCLCTAPNIEKMLAFVLGRSRLDKADMLGYFVAVVLEVDKLADMIFVVRDASGEDGNAGISANAIEGVFVECDDTFESVLFQYRIFDGLFFFGFASERRLGDDDSHTATFDH